MSVEKPLWKTAFAALAAMPLLLALTRAGADIALCVIIALFVADSVRQNNWGWAKQPEMKALGALWVFLLVASAFSPVSVSKSFQGALIWGRFLLFYGAVRFWLLNVSGTLRKLNTIALPTLALVAIDTLWQYKTGTSLTGRPMISDRLTGPLTKANIGNYLLKIGLPMLGLATYRAVAAKRLRLLGACGFGFLTIIGIVMVSGERSTALLLLLSIGMIGLTLFAALPKARLWVLSGMGVIIALMAFVAITQPIVKEKTQFFIEQVSDFWPTYYGQMYIAAWRLWQQNPLTGIGAQQFLEACKPALLQVTYCDVHPHNAYVEWLVATGLPGISLFLLSMALVFRRLWRESVFSGAGAILTTFALCEFAVLLFPLVVTQSIFSNWSAMLFWYSLSIGMSLPQFAKDHDAKA